MKNKLLVVTVILFISLFYSLRADKQIHVTTSQDPPSIKMWLAIDKYAKQYNIPLQYAYGIAYEETRYTGPFDWDYDPALTSYAGALGPMQIMPMTDEWMNKTKFDKKRLLYDIDYNVKTSMKLLRYLHNKYKNWQIVFGCYNTGRPLINHYARNVFNHKISWKLNLKK